MFYSTERKKRKNRAHQKLLKVYFYYLFMVSSTQLKKQIKSLKLAQSREMARLSKQAEKKKLEEELRRLKGMGKKPTRLKKATGFLKKAATSPRAKKVISSIDAAARGAY